MSEPTQEKSLRDHIVEAWNKVKAALTLAEPDEAANRKMLEKLPGAQTAKRTLTKHARLADAALAGENDAPPPPEALSPAEQQKLVEIIRNAQ